MEWFLVIIIDLSSIVGGISGPTTFEKCTESVKIAREEGIKAFCVMMERKEKIKFY